jgi:hypothetical protein
MREISTAMEESERPTEFLEEQIQDNALHSRGDWAAWVAVTTAILAAFAASAPCSAIAVQTKL